MPAKLEESIEIVRDKLQPIEQRLIYPSHDDPRFKGGRQQTVFLAQGSQLTSDRGDAFVEDVLYQYTGRLGFIAAEKRDSLRGTVKRELETDQTAQFFEYFMQRIFDNVNLQVQHIKSAVDPRNGAPFQVLGLAGVGLS